MKRTKVNGVLIYEYDDFNIVKTGTKDYPWNIYKMMGLVLAIGLLVERH